MYSNLNRFHPLPRRVLFAVAGGLLLAGAALAQAVPASAPPPARAAAQKPATAQTLEQAVAQVQNDTRGKVLRADTRQLGRITEFRIKVLTPDGHVRVVSVRSAPAKTTTDKEKH